MVIYKFNMLKNIWRLILYILVKLPTNKACRPSFTRYVDSKVTPSQVCSWSRFDSYSQTTHTFRWGTLSRVDGDLVLSRRGSPPCPRVDGELCPSKGFTTCFVLGIGADGSVFWIMAAASLCLKTLKTHKSIFGL